MDFPSFASVAPDSSEEAVPLAASSSSSVVADMVDLTIESDSESEPEYASDAESDSGDSDFVSSAAAPGTEDSPSKRTRISELKKKLIRRDGVVQVLHHKLSTGLKRLVDNQAASNSDTRRALDQLRELQASSHEQFMHTQKVVNERAEESKKFKQRLAEIEEKAAAERAEHLAHTMTFKQQLADIHAQAKAAEAKAARAEEIAAAVRAELQVQIDELRAQMNGLHADYIARLKGLQKALKGDLSAQRSDLQKEYLEAGTVYSKTFGELLTRVRSLEAELLRSVPGTPTRASKRK